MVDFIDSIVSKVINIEQSGDDTVVTVRVKGVGDDIDVAGITRVNPPNIITNARARARALVAAGAAPSSAATLKDIAFGDLQRLTEVENVVDEGTGDIVNKVYTIRVNS